MDDRFHRIVEGNRHDFIHEPSDARELPLGIAAGLIAGTVAAGMRLHQRRSA